MDAITNHLQFPFSEKKAEDKFHWPLCYMLDINDRLPKEMLLARLVCYLKLTVNHRIHSPHSPRLGGLITSAWL